jgi:hypothetical protein
VPLSGTVRTQCVLIEKEKELGGFSGSFSCRCFLEKYYHYILESDDDIEQLIEKYHFLQNSCGLI